MADFTRAIFASKELFGPEEMKQFSLLETARERLEFVDQTVPAGVTLLPTAGSNQGEQEEHQEECLKVKEEDLEDLVEEKPLFKSHPRFPMLSEAVKVEYSPGRGRHLTAGRRVRLGEVVAVERPAVVFPVTRDWAAHCALCLGPLPSSGGLQCGTCRAVTFCSAGCRRAAQASHHRYECPLGLLQMLGKGHPGIGKLFMIVRLFTQRTVGWFMEHGEELLRHRPERGSGLTDSLASDYHTLFNLARHDPTDPAKLLEVSLVSLVLVRMLGSVGYFSQGELRKEQEARVGELASTLVSVVNVNTHPVHDMRCEEECKTLCAAIYPVVAALFNHSCDPSLVRVSWGNRVVLAAGRELGEGEELTDMYTVHWTEYSTQERRDYLWRMFHFTCDCPACRGGWGPPPDSSSPDPELVTRLPSLDPELVTRLAAHNVRVASEHRLLGLLGLR